MKKILARVKAGLFFTVMGIVLGFFTLLDLAVHYLARKRRMNLGARPMLGLLWSLLLIPSRPAFWFVGFWLALGALVSVIYRILIQENGALSTAGLP